MTLLVGLLTCLSSMEIATANGGSETWTFDITTTGNDVFWTSPTAVDPTAAVFCASYQITKVEVDVTWNGIPFNNIDVTNLVDPLLLSGSGCLNGPAPIVLLDQNVVVPPPPDPPAIQADLFLGLDAAGFGSASATNVVLGTLDLDLGPFGIQTVTIVSARVVGTITAAPTWFDLGNALAGISGPPQLDGMGTLADSDPVTLTLSSARPGAPAFLFIGFSTLNAPFKGGTLVPAVDFLFLGLGTDAAGQLTLATSFPPGLPACTSLYLQYWIVDAAGPKGFSASNAVQGITP